jgi:hypothetical protein
MCDTGLVRLHVNFGFFVLDRMLFDGLKVNAGILYRLLGVAAGNFNPQSIKHGRRFGFRGRRILILLSHSGKQRYAGEHRGDQD